MPKSGRGYRTRHNISHQILVPARNPKSIGHARRGTGTFKTFVVFIMFRRARAFARGR